ncbi:MAG: hypothetical protein A2097_00670 [Desulfobacula sp. GWF2_41_7]|nr:MAG: hypothetical protein A2097_00670 [Desulfobacula sp. GWF2_41_7]
MPEQVKGALTIDTAVVHSHFQGLVCLGVPKKRLEAVLGMTEDELSIRDSRVSGIKNIEMIEKAIALIGPEIPIKLGKTVSLERMGVCGYILKNCRNLSEAVQQFIRYQRLIYAVSSFRIIYKTNVVLIEHKIKTPMYKAYNRILVELSFSAITTVLTNLMEKEYKVLEFRFTGSMPKNHFYYYKETFNGRLLFNQGMDAIVMETEQLKQPVPQSQTYIRGVMAQHADRLLENIGKTGFLAEVEQIIMENLPKGIVDIEMVSEKLNVSRWTLNRKLKTHGTTFQGLLNEIRRKMASCYLADKKLSVSETAFLLGYSELSAFSRAYKKWTGKNPTQANLID